MALVDGASQSGDSVQNGHRHTVGGHVGRGVNAEGNADVETWRVLCEVGLGEVGVGGVGDVGGDEERVGKGLTHEAWAKGSLAISGSEGLDGALDCQREEVATSTLAEQRANFLIVEESDELDDALLLLLLGVEKSHEGGPGAELVVDATGKNEFLVHTADLGRLGVVKLELPVEDCAIVLDANLRSDELDKLGGLGSGKGTNTAERGFRRGGRGTTNVAVVETNDWNGFGFAVIVAHHADSKVRSESRDTSNW